MTGRHGLGDSAAMKLLFSILLFVLASSARVLAQEAAAPVLDLPVDCDPSAECSIQKYFDHDPGPGRLDYACGRLSRDGDTGTDFRLANYPAMDRGVSVLAAADGVVRAVRDGMDDVSVRDTDAASIEGREAGNAVAVTHGNGWETQYSHLKRGSIGVKVGDAVKVGDVLGEVGLSGNTEFPHVEFTVRRSGVAVDPFVGAGEFRLCGEATDPLWSEAALAKLAYRPAVILSSGFHSGPADAQAARIGDYDRAAVDASAAALVFWVDLSGAQKDDHERLVMTGPDGKELVRLDRVLEENNISWFVFAGAKKPEKGWKIGDYRAEYSLTRDGEVLAEKSQTLSLKAVRD